jgi:DNA polymerase IV
LPGIGPALARRLAAQGITLLGHLQALNDREAKRRLGEHGPSLVRRARGEDDGRVDPGRETKSISAEVTFNTDLHGSPIWRCMSGACPRNSRAG